MTALLKRTRFETALGMCLLLVAGFWLATGAGASAQSDGGGYAEVWGPSAGTPLPLLAAQDQDGRPRGLEDLTGPQGLLLFLYRSADW